MPNVIEKITEIPLDVGLNLPYNMELDKLTLTPRELNQHMDYQPIILYGDPMVLPLEYPDHTVDYDPESFIEIKVYIYLFTM